MTKIHRKKRRGEKGPSSKCEKRRRNEIHLFAVNIVAKSLAIAVAADTATVDDDALTGSSKTVFLVVNETDVADGLMVL
jgi:hypothetical protein